MSGSRDYITNTVRLAGPAPGTGEQDVQIADNTDFIFGDNEELKFGDDGDVGIKWDASNLTILPATDLTGAINIGNGTLSMDLKVFGTEAANYFEYDASEDRLNLVIVTRTITGEDHALDIAYAGVCAAGGSDAMVGVNVAVAPTGAGANWVSAFFGKVDVVAAAPGPVSGYFCGAEFEINITGSQPCAYGVLVLNSNADNSTYGQHEAYIWLREYGSNAVRSLFEFVDHTRASASDSIIVSQAPQTPFDTMIRCTIGSAGTTGLWLLASTVGPASLANFKWIGSGATKYLEIDASNDRVNMALMGFKWTNASFSGKGLDFNDAVFAAGSNYNLLSYGDYGNTVTLSITDYTFVMRMNVTSAADPSGVRGFAFVNLEFAQSTEAQANLWVHGIAQSFTLTQNLQWINGVNLYVNIADTLTVTQGVHALKAGINLTSAKTLTYHDAAVILAEVTGAGVNSCSGPAASELCCLMLKVAAVSTIGSMITFFQINGCAVTNGIYVGSGALTNLFNFERGNAVTAVSIGAQCQTDSGSGVDSDGAIRILVAGTPYYIPLYSATNTSGSW